MHNLAIETIPGVSSAVTVWVQAGVHGDEEEGVLALQRYVSQARTQPPPVNVIALCPANPVAFEVRARCSPEDGLDLNRCFPGDPEGSPSQRRAAEIWAALSSCHGVIDIHSSSEILIGAPHTIVQTGDSTLQRRGIDAGRATGLQILWKSAGAWLGGSLMHTAMAAGIPACLVDVGSTRPWETARALEKSLTPLMHAYAALAGVDLDDPDGRLASNAAEVEYEIPDPSWVTSPAKGWIIDLKGPASRVLPGDTVAVVWAEDGTTIPLHWEGSGPGLVVTVRARREVAEGDALVSIAALTDS